MNMGPFHASLTPAELSAMRADGETWPLGSGFIFVDVPVDVRSRLGVLLDGTPPGLVAMGMSAAWAWGHLRNLPTKCDVARDDGMRLGISIAERFRIRDVSWSEGDIITMKMGNLTSIERTMLDIARYEQSSSAQEVTAVIADLERGLPGSLSKARQRLLGVAHLPYKAQALTRLALADRAAYPSLTR